eukprot:CAMPEP_0179097850 /NCGR_PEP_ID=MMETSP0796-20121207/45058_1 /TAXON_ID=73915 /ORGANISM="Pyrodinium bahamense, Strain pbaha01" /LENGTH=56 /DNA_ID=CAMNT_0020795605 /DNA_START=768 /DNA_END=935 /DNA_ORIENTATION=-
MSNTGRSLSSGRATRRHRAPEGLPKKEDPPKVVARSQPRPASRQARRAEEDRATNS